MKTNTQIMFISHGGGPMPLLGDAGHQEMVECLQSIATEIKKPSAILVISAHWEESVPTITASAKPSLLYDYYGFPQKSYEIKYPCPGEPQLASKIHSALENAGIKSALDEERGLDHGVFVPLTIMYPDADIPCVELSLVNSLDPALHIKIGQALQDLDYENLLIIGSGFSFHNMKAFFTKDGGEARKQNESFDAWLIDTCSNTEISEVQRLQRLTDWD